VMRTRMDGRAVSIIVPIYNAASHLRASLLGIKRQTYSDWECICVDDGSTDGSVDIIHDFMHSDPRYRLIRQDNGGPGAARNRGLDLCRSRYFTFVDADDLIHPAMLQWLHETATENNADLVVCEIVRFELDSEFEIIAREQNTAGNSEKALGPFLEQMLDWRKFRVHPVGKLYNSSVHVGLRFPHHYGAEDDFFSLDVYARSRLAVFLRTPLYGYRQTDGSLTRSAEKYASYLAGDVEVAVHAAEVSKKLGISLPVSSQLVARYVMRMFCFINEMAADPRLSSSQKRKLMNSAADGFHRIKCAVGPLRRIIPSVHIVPYLAVTFRALWLLHLWQTVRKVISLKRHMAPQGKVRPT